MCGFLNTVASVALPIAGSIIGGPIGGAIGGAIGGSISGAGPLRGAIGGYAGSFSVPGLANTASSLFGDAGSFLSGLGEGGAGEAIGATAEGAGGAIAGGAGEAAMYAGGDPIQLIDQLDTIGGGQGATAGAQALGYDSVSSAIANAANWSGESTMSALPGGGDASQGSFTGAPNSATGASPAGMARAATAGVRGAPNTSLMSPLSIAQGAYGLYNSNRLKQLAAEQALKADPNSAYRASYAARLNSLSTDPSSIFSTPGYAAGEQAVQRTMAAQGYTGSGNARIAMQKYGGDFYNQEMQRLMTLSGGNAGQTVAPALNLAGNESAINLAGQSLNSIGYGATARRPLTLPDAAALIRGY